MVIIMKPRSILFVLIFAGIFCSIISFGSEQNKSVAPSWYDWTRAKMSQGNTIPLLGIAAATIGMSYEVMHYRVITLLQKYYKLLVEKNASEQLEILMRAKKSINFYTSPLENKVIDDIIWLQKVFVEMVKEKSPVEQIRSLKKYRNSVLSAPREAGEGSRSLLPQYGWFARQFYYADVMMGGRIYLDQSLDKILIEGLIKDIARKNNLKSWYIW
jgi:hypothetical protein